MKSKYVIKGGAILRNLIYLLFGYIMLFELILLFLFFPEKFADFYNLLAALIIFAMSYALTIVSLFRIYKDEYED